MTERDKLIAQAEAFDGIVAYFAQFPKDRMFAAGDIVWKIRDDATELRALAAQQPEAVEPVALFTQTDYDAERWTALMLLWQLGQVTLTGDDAGMFVVDFEGAESADRLWKGADPEECLRNVIESFMTEGWDFDAIRTQSSAPADQPLQVRRDESTGEWLPVFRDAPADHTAADAPIDGGAIAGTPELPAVGVTPDLDALVALRRYEVTSQNSSHFYQTDTGRFVFYDEAAQAITDLRAQLAEKERETETYKKRLFGAIESTGILAAALRTIDHDSWPDRGVFSSLLDVANVQAARITRLEADNAQARELLDEALDKFSRILDAKGPDDCSMSVLREFVNRANATIKQGATP